MYLCIYLVIILSCVLIIVLVLKNLFIFLADIMEEIKKAKFVEPTPIQVQSILYGITINWTHYLNLLNVYG